MAKKEKKNARPKISEKKSLFSFFDIFKKILMFVGSFVGILFVWSQVKAISGEPQASTVEKRLFLQWFQWTFYGSGLVAEPNLPARYFYGELKDYWGRRVDVRKHFVEKDLQMVIVDPNTGKLFDITTVNLGR